MKKLLFFLLAAIVLGRPAFACINGFSEEFGGRIKASSKSFPVPKGHPISITADEASEFTYNGKRGIENGDYDAAIDYGLMFTYLGKYEEAEEQFAKIAKKWPDNYEACANYGTILEVNGKLEEALKWLKKAIQISPNSHEGSEWLHLAIIEDKIAQRKSVDGATLTGQNFGNEAEPKPVVSKQATRKLQRDLFYQLNERMTFIQPKDPYIAALLFELGNACILLDDRKSALENFESAKRYGFHAPLLQQRIAFAKSQKPLSFAFSVDRDTVAPTPRLDTLPPPPPLRIPKQPAPSGSSPWRIIALVVSGIAALSLAIRMLRRRNS